MMTIMQKIVAFVIIAGLIQLWAMCWCELPDVDGSSRIIMTLGTSLLGLLLYVVVRKKSQEY